ncbi:MAG: hypothetical protein M3Q34_00805 [bacterium]|nr:hypothetical protein [bacterium]
MDSQITKYESSLLVVLVMVAIFGYIFLNENKKRSNELERVHLEQIRKVTEVENETKREIENLDILATAISVYDVDLDKKIYGKNDTTVKPLASLAKTLTVLVALNTNSYNDITVTENALQEEGDYGLKESETWGVADLAKFTLVLSANDGASALSRNDRNFLNKMNIEAKYIGMKDARFLNVTGLDIDEELAGAYGSAVDANKMAIHALEKYPNIFKATILPELQLKSKSGFSYNIKNTNPSVEEIPNIEFSKTGFTDLAGGNLTIIFRNINGHKIAVTLLGSTFSGRFLDIEKIVHVLYNTYKYE